MITHHQITVAVRESLNDCYTCDAPYECLSHKLSELKKRPEWTAEAAAQVEGKAVRMLAILLEPDGHA